MSKEEIRPAANGTDTTTTTTPTASEPSRVCSQCGQLTAIADMSPKRTICKDCRAEYERRWRAANPGRGWMKDHRRRKRAYGLHHIVTEYLTPEDIVAHWGDACFYNANHPFEVIDHVIPVRAGGPHQIWNVVASCHSCNAKKRWTTDQAWIEWRLGMDSSGNPENGPSDAASAT